MDATNSNQIHKDKPKYSNQIHKDKPKSESIGQGKRAGVAEVPTECTF